MHELPVTESLLEIALRHANKAGASRILSLNIVIGQLASIVDDSVQFYWDMIAENTPAQGAQLNFKRIPPELQCLECDKKYTPGGDDMACPDCGSAQVKIVAGREFYLDSIEVE